MSFDFKKYYKNNPLLEVSFEFTDQEIDPVKRSISSKVKYLPDFEKAFRDLKTARDTLQSVSRHKDVDGDNKLDQIFERLAKVFNELRTHIRKNYSDEYSKIREGKENDIRLLVRKTLKEMSTTAGVPGYQTPYAFKRKSKRRNNN